MPEQEDQEKLEFIPPETHYLSTKYMVKIPVTDKHLNNRWELRVYASKLVERHLRDEVQVTSLKLKKPHILKREVAKLRGQTPYARAYVTIKF
jgi:hypothetical protein